MQALSAKSELRNQLPGAFCSNQSTLYYYEYNNTYLVEDNNPKRAPVEQGAAALSDLESLRSRHQHVERRWQSHAAAVLGDILAWVPRAQSLCRNNNTSDSIHIRSRILWRVSTVEPRWFYPLWLVCQRFVVRQQQPLNKPQGLVRMFRSTLPRPVAPLGDRSAPGRGPGAAAA